MKLQNMKRGETTEQITLFNWAENNKHILPCLSLMYHIPNEGKRTNGAVLKAMGLKSGVLWSGRSKGGNIGLFAGPGQNAAFQVLKCTMD